MTITDRDPTAVEVLEQEIRSSVGTDHVVQTKLATSERIIARVTDGIYREPWAAFRELIANAYDADASYVIIETGQPEFERMTVRDDGVGMSPKTLAYVLKNIGGSSKRTSVGAELNTARPDSPHLSPGGRPLIGKIGIGLFAVAQLTQHFQIITKAAGERHRISATVKLQTHDEARVLDLDAEFDAGLVDIVLQEVPENEEETHGTSVVLYHMRHEVRHTLQSSRLWNASSVDAGGGESVQKPPEYHIGGNFNGISTEPHLPWDDTDSPENKFNQLFHATGKASGRGIKSANLDHLDEYLRLVWKLSLSLPLEYIDRHPFDLDGETGIMFLEFPEGGGQAEIIDLEPNETVRQHLNLQADAGPAGLQFSVVIDGIALKRPIVLPIELVRKRSRVGRPVMVAARKHNVFRYKDLERAGGALSFEAYLYWNDQIVPKETAGVLIRIREASGTLFDPTFLNYQVSEQTRLRQIIAEIFVHEGLDAAVNIDRESFNYSHPHFLYIQRWLHRALRLLMNRLKHVSAADLARHKEQLRGQALSYAAQVWSRRLGNEAEPPFPGMALSQLPGEIGGVDIEWPLDGVFNDKGRLVGTERLSALAAILEAYGLLSALPIDDRSRVITDIVGIPETNT